MSDRGRSRSRSPPRGGGRVERIPGCGLLVRNLPLDTRADELRDMFGRYGRVSDVYLPRDYYSGRPKGFGFVEFANHDDAQEAIYQLDRRLFGGRELSVCIAKEGRKRPEDMRGRGGGRRGGRGGGRRRYSRSPRRGRSRSPRRGRSPSPSRSPPRGRSTSRSRSRSPYNKNNSPRRSRSPSPPTAGGVPRRSSRSPSPPRRVSPGGGDE